MHDWPRHRSRCILRCTPTRLFPARAPRRSRLSEAARRRGVPVVVVAGSSPVVVVAAYLIRRHLEEPPAFEEAVAEATGLELLRIGDMNVLGASVMAQALMVAVTLLSALGPIRIEE